MNRKKYLGILAIITVACIIGGSLIHGIARQHRLSQYASEFQEAKQEIKEEFEDDLDEDLDDLDEEIRDDLDADLTDDQEDKAEDAAKDHSNEIALEGTAGVAFTAMEIDTGVADLDIEIGADYGVTYYVSNDKFKPTAEYKDGVLYLKQKQLSNWKDMDMKDLISLMHTGQVQITVTVPANTTLDGITIDQGTGDIGLDGEGGLTANKIDIDCGTGDMEISHLTAQTIKADGGTGDVELEDLSCKQIDIDGGTGDCELENVVFDMLDIGGGTGDVRIIGVADLMSYQLDLDTGAGTIMINGAKEGGDFIWNPEGADAADSAARYIKIDGGAGDIIFSQAD